MSNMLTREHLELFRDRILDAPVRPREPMVICHPIEHPFYRAYFGQVQVSDLDKVMRWQRDCLRKWKMGQKTGDKRWTLSALVDQYTALIERLAADGKP